MVHWPVIVILTSMMVSGAYFSLCALTVSFGLAVALHHFVENPLRNANQGVHVVDHSSKVAAGAALALVAVGVCAYAAHPEAFAPSTSPSAIGHETR